MSKNREKEAGTRHNVLFSDNDVLDTKEKRHRASMYSTSSPREAAQQSKVSSLHCRSFLKVQRSAGFYSSFMFNEEKSGARVIFIDFFSLLMP